MFAAINGHAEATAPRSGKLSEDEKDDLFTWLEAGAAAPEVSGRVTRLAWDGIRLSPE